MSRLIAVLLLILIALMPTTGVMSQGPGVDANGVVSGGVAGPGVEAGSCAEAGALEELSIESTDYPLVCFSFTDPGYPDLQWYVVIIPYPGIILGGAIFGTICGGTWLIAPDGSIGADKITFDAICASGMDCQFCPLTVHVEVTRIPGTGRWTGTYTYNGVDMHPCQMQWFPCPFVD